MPKVVPLLLSYDWTKPSTLILRMKNGTMADFKKVQASVDGRRVYEWQAEVQDRKPVMTLKLKDPPAEGRKVVVRLRRVGDFVLVYSVVCGARSRPQTRTPAAATSSP
jgi:hypothetical protein